MMESLHDLMSQNCRNPGSLVYIVYMSIHICIYIYHHYIYMYIHTHVYLMYVSMYGRAGFLSSTVPSRVEQLKSEGMPL